MSDRNSTDDIADDGFHLAAMVRSSSEAVFSEIEVRDKHQLFRTNPTGFHTALVRMLTPRRWIT